MLGKFQNPLYKCHYEVLYWVKNIISVKKTWYLRDIIAGCGAKTEKNRLAKTAHGGKS